ALGHPVTFTGGSWWILSLPWKGNSAWVCVCEERFGRCRPRRGIAKAHISALQLGTRAGDRRHLSDRAFKVSRFRRPTGRAGGGQPAARHSPAHVSGASLGLAAPRPAPRAGPGSGRPRGRSPPGRAAASPAGLRERPRPGRPRPRAAAAPRTPPSPARTHPATGGPAAAASAPGAPCSPGGSDSPPPSSPPPLLLLLLLLRLLQSPRSAAWAARLLRSPREPRNPSAGATCAPAPRPPPRRPPRPPPPAGRAPGPGHRSHPPSLVCSPDRFPKANGKNRSVRPPAPPIRRFASNKHKLSQAPPRPSWPWRDSSGNAIALAPFRDTPRSTTAESPA
ncbi:hypothetical protein MC885_010400, partial [Smutsia gigantea]